MIHSHRLSMIFTILIISSSLINISSSSESGNWLTKSLDYFGLEKCSPLDKSGITGDFYTCLNKPVEESSTSTTGPSSSGSSDWSQFSSGAGTGAGGGSKMGSFNSFSGKSGSFNSFSSGQSKSSPSTSPDSWPLSLITDLRQMINCFPALIKPCMTQSEVQFFNTIRNFFQSQVNYATPNASSIAAEIVSSRCVKSNSIDTNTVCYSTNIHKQNWFGWKINWSDGQMCRFIHDISKCEIVSFDQCSDRVKSFANQLWESGLRVTPCHDVTTSTPSPVTSNPVVHSTKSLAPGLPVNPNQSPSRQTNINSNGLKVNRLTVIEPVVRSNQEDEVSSKPKPPQRLQPFDNRNGMGDFNRFNRQIDDNEEEEEEDEDDYNERRNDFKGKMEHLKRVRLHEVDGEGESHHERVKKHHDVEEEQWSRIKEEFKRKMRESMESQESIESEYEEESEESDEDKNFDLFEDRKMLLAPRHRNQEDDHRDARRDRQNSRDTFGIRNEEEQRRREVPDRRQRANEEENRRREREERRREDEERRREADDRRREEEERRREEEENARRMERERENARKVREERRGWDDGDNDDVTEKPERYLTQVRSVNRWGNLNHQRNQKIGPESSESKIRDCIGSTMNSWSSLAENHNSNDLMDLMCRNMDSIHSCLNKHPQTSSNGQENRLGHLKFLHSTLCDSNNRLKDTNTMNRVKQCLNDQSPSSVGSMLQTKYPNGASSRFWH